MSNLEETPLVSVIIVTWNSASHLPRCLDCLQAQTFKDFEVILVDNASKDGALEGLESHWPGLRLLVKKLEENRGFAGANNVGAALARGTWLALLNSDAFPEPEWLGTLLQAARQHPQFSFFASRQIQANEPSLLDGAGDAYHVSGLAWRRFSGMPAARFGLQAEEVFSPCAASALYLRRAFLQVGGFDEDFFSYQEDVDLGFRLRLQGYRCMYLPGAVVEHIGSASTGKRSSFAIYHGHRNLVWTYIKDMPSVLFWLYLPVHLFMNLSFLFYFSARGQAGAIWRAKWDALRGLGRVLAKRKVIQRGRSLAASGLYQQMEQDWLTPLRVKAQRQRFVDEGE